MNNINAEWQREFYLTHDKYRMQRQGTDCYKVVKGLTRILQLPTIAKLTTDNESVIGDFRLNRGEYGLEPYDEYAIKVDDTYGASFYILVHRKADTTFLCPILVGFEGENTCAMVKPTDNWRMREKVVIAAESGKKMTALAAMYASERGYSFIPVANDDLPTYLAKQQQKGCVVFDGAENEREIENTCRELRIPLRHCKLEGA